MGVAAYILKREGVRVATAKQRIQQLNKKWRDDLDELECRIATLLDNAWPMEAEMVIQRINRYLAFMFNICELGCEVLKPILPSTTAFCGSRLMTFFSPISTPLENQLLISFYIERSSSIFTTAIVACMSATCLATIDVIPQMNFHQLDMYLHDIPLTAKFYEL